MSRLLSALEEPGRTLVLMAVLTGMRIGELLALRWKNVDFEGKTIRVREAVYEGHNSTPKTQGGNRDIPFGPTLEQALRHHLGRLPQSQRNSSATWKSAEALAAPGLRESGTPTFQLA